MTLVGCGAEKSIDKPKCLFYLPEWIVHGTGYTDRKGYRKRNSQSFKYIYIVHVTSWYSCSVWVFITLLIYAATSKV